MPREKQYLANQAELVSTVYIFVCLSFSAFAELVHVVLGDWMVAWLTFPPSTSSPMIRHAAVLIMRLLSEFVAAMARDVRDVRLGRAAELCR